jgi:hypothetical protein
LIHLAVVKDTPTIDYDDMDNGVMSDKVRNVELEGTVKFKSLRVINEHANKEKEKEKDKIK